MIIEGRKLTAFDAMEAAINLSEMYIARNTHKVVNFRWSQSMEAVIFEFGKWEGFDYNSTDHYTVYLDNTTSAGNTFAELFDKLNEEIEKMLKENVNVQF